MHPLRIGVVQNRHLGTVRAARPCATARKEYHAGQEWPVPGLLPESHTASGLRKDPIGLHRTAPWGHLVNPICGAEDWKAAEEENGVRAPVGSGAPKPKVLPALASPGPWNKTWKIPRNQGGEQHQRAWSVPAHGHSAVSRSSWKNKAPVWKREFMWQAPLPSPHGGAWFRFCYQHLLVRLSRSSPWTPADTNLVPTWVSSL